MKDNSNQNILIHADGTIQVHRAASGRQFRLGSKTFKLAEQAHNDECLGPYVYTEMPTTSEVIAEVIPLRPYSNHDYSHFSEEAYAN